MRVFFLQQRHTSNLLPVKKLTELDLTEAEDAAVCTVHHRLDDLCYCPWAHLSLWKTQGDSPFKVNLQFSRIQEILFGNSNSKMICHELNSYSRLVTENHIHDFSIFTQVWDCMCLNVLQRVACFCNLFQHGSSGARLLQQRTLPIHHRANKTSNNKNSLLLLLATSSAVSVAQSSSLAWALQQKHFVC